MGLGVLVEPGSPCPLQGGALTDVGELHSLTDWQVSEASEDAELEDFCWGEESRPGHSPGQGIPPQRR